MSITPAIPYINFVRCCLSCLNAARTHRSIMQPFMKSTRTSVTSVPPSLSRQSSTRASNFHSYPGTALPVIARTGGESEYSSPTAVVMLFLTRGCRYGLVIPRQAYPPLLPTVSSLHNTREHHRNFLHSSLLIRDSRRFGDILEHPARSSTSSFPLAPHGVYGFPS